jgi:effector-binding domain-containing protein
MDYNIKLSEEPSQPVLSIRVRTAVDKLPEVLGNIYGTVIQYLNEIGEKPHDLVFAAYHNMDMNDLDLEAGFVLKKPLPGKDDIQASEIPPGKQIFCLHKGPYSKVEPAYGAMMQWAEKNNCTPTGVAYEFYYNSPTEVPESELLTKIMFPVVSNQ